VRAAGQNDRLSVWNQPRSEAPCTLYASSVWHATSKSPPIERTVPSQVHPAAQRRLFPTSLISRSSDSRVLSTLSWSLLALMGASALTRPRQLAHAVAPSSPRAAANPSPGPRPATPLVPRNATTRSAASALTPRCPPSAVAYSRSRSAARTTGSRHSPAASAATATPAPRPGHVRACCPPC